MQKYHLIQASFFDGDDPVHIARKLIGKLIVSHKHQKLTAGIVTECEAYWAPHDMASHARNYTRTPRNEVMYAAPGTAYVYICYGIHRLFNIVTAAEGIPHAILIRAIQPVEGIDIMLERRKRKYVDPSLSSGLGSLSLCLGIGMEDNGVSLVSNGSAINICHGIELPSDAITATPRIGVESAGHSSSLLYRFVMKENPFISAVSFTRKFF